MKKLLIISLFIVNLYSNEYNLTLKEFTEVVAVQNKVNILINDDIESNKILFIVANTKNLVDIRQFKNMLTAKDLILIEYRDFYFIDESQKTFLQLERQHKKLNRFFTVDYLTNEDIKTIFGYYNLDYIYLDNKIMTTCDNDTYRRLNQILKQYDNKKIKNGCDYFKTSTNDINGKKHINIEYINNCPTDYENYLASKKQSKLKEKKKSISPVPKKEATSKPKSKPKEEDKKKEKKEKSQIVMQGVPFSK